MDELLARIAALIRRARGHARPLLPCGGLAIDTAARQVTLRGRTVRLTALEYAMPAVLARRVGQPICKPDLTHHLHDQSCDRDSN